MKSLKIGAVVLSILLLFLWISGLCVWKWDLLKASNDYFTGFATILAAIVAVIGVYLTIKHNNETKKKELLDNLDSKSEWRKQLYDVASKTFLTTDDVYRVLASLRYFPHEKIGEGNERHFREATQIIYRDLYSIIEKYEEDIKNNILNKNDNPIILNFGHSENVRIYTKYLLKHHWEHNKGKASFLLKEEEVWDKTKNLVKENKITYLNEIKNINYKECEINSKNEIASKINSKQSVFDIFVLFFVAHKVHKKLKGK